MALTQSCTPSTVGRKMAPSGPLKVPTLATTTGDRFPPVLAGVPGASPDWPGVPGIGPGNVPPGAFAWSLDSLGFDPAAVAPLAFWVAPWDGLFDPAVPTPAADGLRGVEAVAGCPTWELPGAAGIEPCISAPSLEFGVTATLCEGPEAGSSALVGRPSALSWTTRVPQPAVNRAVISPEMAIRPRGDGAFRIRRRVPVAARSMAPTCVYRIDSCGPELRRRDTIPTFLGVDHSKISVTRQALPGGP
jgi:hypothetical protein